MVEPRPQRVRAYQQRRGAAGGAGGECNRRRKLPRHRRDVRRGSLGAPGRELTASTDIVVATKFPFGYFSRASSLPAILEGSLARLQRPRIDLYQIHYPLRWKSIPTLMGLM